MDGCVRSDHNCRMPCMLKTVCVLILVPLTCCSYKLRNNSSQILVSIYVWCIMVHEADTLSRRICRVRFVHRSKLFHFQINKTDNVLSIYVYRCRLVGWYEFIRRDWFFFGKSTTNAIIKLIDINTNHCYDKLNISFSKMSLCFWIKFATSKWSTSVLMMIGAKKTETNLVFSFTEWMSCVRRTLQK